MRARRFCSRATNSARLIVIEQQSGLKEFVESGTLLNANLSAELLLALFMPRSPLHDGAVIVRENVIEAAGCFLPLAEQSLAERRVGTRHRAALGLTEQTDAVVIVVSEETGAISIAREGKLSRPVEEEARLVKCCSRLRARRAIIAVEPTTSCRTSAPASRRIAAKETSVQIIRKNFGLKVLSLALAIVGWAYFRFASNPVIAAHFDQQISVPIVAANLPVGYIAHFTEKDAVVTVAL